MSNFLLFSEEIERRYQELIEKRFPADTTLEVLTFLNDKKVDGELYAIFQSLSLPIEVEEGVYKTIVYKCNLPTQKKLGELLKYTARTYRNHLKYLIERGYIVELEDGNYELPNCEDIYFQIPLQTVDYLTTLCTEDVIKVYIYLGQRWKYSREILKRPYNFTVKEIAEHLGLKATGRVDVYTKINFILDLLYSKNLIDYKDAERVKDSQWPQKILTMFRTEITIKE